MAYDHEGKCRSMDLPLRECEVNSRSQLIQSMSLRHQRTVRSLSDESKSLTAAGRKGRCETIPLANLRSRVIIHSLFFLLLPFFIRFIVCLLSYLFSFRGHRRQHFRSLDSCVCASVFDTLSACSILMANDKMRYERNQVVIKEGSSQKEITGRITILDDDRRQCFRFLPLGLEETMADEWALVT